MKFKWALFLLLGMLALTSCDNKDREVEVSQEQGAQVEEVVEVAEASEEDSVATDEMVQEEVIVMKREAITDSGFIKANGQNLYTDYGRGELINLRGVNVGGYLFQEFWMTIGQPSEHIKAEADIYTYLTETYGEDKMYELLDIYQDNYFTIEDFDNLYEMGVNCIRLPFWYRNLVDSQGVLLENWYERFDWFIEEAGARGIYVILDFHGAPGSQNGSDHSGVDGEDDKIGASEFFFGDQVIIDKNQALYYQLWEVIADRYQGNPTVAGYDLLNEPYCTYRYDSRVSADALHEALWTVYDEAYKRIRAIDPDHIIIMEATWDPIDLPNPEDYGWTNVMYEYHNYLFDDYYNAEGRQISNMEKKVNLIKSADYDVPVFMGEFNYFDSYNAWEQGLALLNDNGINWTMWTYKTVSEYMNWGLYHHIGVVDFSLEEASLLTIEDKWSKVGRSKVNEQLAKVFTQYVNQEMIGY